MPDDKLIIRFTIPGEPIPKARSRTFAKTNIEGKPIFQNGKLVMRSMTPDKTKTWEEFVSLVSRKAAVKHGLRNPVPLKTPVLLGCVFYLPIPSSWSIKNRQDARDGKIRHTSKPDLSNLLKSIEDGAEGVLWTNDTQIDGYCDVDGVFTSKRYADDPHTDIEVRAVVDFS